MSAKPASQVSAPETAASPTSVVEQQSAPASNTPRRVIKLAEVPTRTLGVDFETDPEKAAPGYSKEDAAKLVEDVTCVVTEDRSMTVRDKNRRFEQVSVRRNERVVIPRWFAMLNTRTFSPLSKD